MKTCNAVALFLLLVLAGCESTPPESGMELKLSFPRRETDGQGTDAGIILPLHADSLEMEVDVSARIPRLLDAPQATVSVDAPATPQESARSTTLRLAKEGEDTFTGRVKLRAPSPGLVVVRASVIGEEEAREVEIRKPELAIGSPERDGWSAGIPRYKVCIESTAASGTLKVNANGATILGVQEGQVALEKGACGQGLGIEAPRSHSQILVSTLEPTFILGAVLNGTGTESRRSLEAIGQPLKLLLGTNPPELLTLPPAGSLIKLRLFVTEGQQPAPGIPVSFATLPTALILPSSAITDAQGEAMATLLVPADINSLLISATAGNQRADLILPP